MPRIPEFNSWKVNHRKVVLGAFLILAMLIVTTAGIAATRKRQKVNTYSATPQDYLPAEPKLITRQIVWPARKTISEELRRRLTIPELTSIDASLLPVLLPDLPEVGEGSFLKNSYGYSFSISSSHYSMVIYAFSEQYTGDPVRDTEETISKLRRLIASEGRQP
jgi:hypothetical protein